MTVYISKEDNDHVIMTNDLGADLDQYEFCVVGPYAAIADQDIASLAEGSFHVAEGIQFQTDDLVAGELTFATQGQEVYWSAADNAFSDTETAGYYLIGYLVEVKNSDGMIVVEKTRYATLITT